MGGFMTGKSFRHMRRILAMVLVVIMTVTLVPLDFIKLNVQAAEGDGTATPGNPVGGGVYGARAVKPDYIIDFDGVTDTGNDGYSVVGGVVANFFASNGKVQMSNGTTVIEAVPRTDDKKWTFGANVLKTGGGVSGGKGYFTITIPAGYTGIISANFVSASAESRTLCISQSANTSGALVTETSTSTSDSKTVESESLAEGTYYVVPGASIWISYVGVTLEEDSAVPSLKEMTTSTLEESCDFKTTSKIFGLDSVTEDAVFSTNKYIKLEKGDDNETLDTSGGHGLKFAQKVTFTTLVPANSKGTFTIMECQWPSCTATMSIDGEAQESSVTIAATSDGDGETKELVYENTTSDTVTMTVELIGGSACYVHGVAYKVGEITSSRAVAAEIKYDGQKIADVSGSYVSSGSSSNNLEITPTYDFTDEPDSSKLTAERNAATDELDGTYTVSMADGKINFLVNGTIEATMKYTVAGKAVIKEKYYITGSDFSESGWADKASWSKEVFSTTAAGGVKMRNQSGFMQLGNTLNQGDGKNGIDITIPGDTGDWDLKVSYTSKANGTTSKFIYGVVGDSFITYDAGSDGQDTSTYQYTLVQTLKGGSADKTYRIGTDKGAYVYLFELYHTEAETFTGQVQCSSTLPEGLKVIFTQVIKTNSDGSKVYGEDKYEATVSNGSYSVDIPVSEADKVFEVSVDDANYIITAPVTKDITFNKSTGTTIDLTVSKVATYTLSGTYTTGLSSEEVAKVTGLEFTPTTASEYVVPAATLQSGNYSVKLEKGTSYQVSALGVNDYEITNDTFTYSNDTELNLEFVKKPVYKVTLNLGSTPDLSGLSVNYVFTHEDGSEYTFTDKNAVELRDGKYTVSITGDMDRVPYKIGTGASLTVSGAAVSHVIKFNEITSWDFTSTFTQTFEGRVDFYQGLMIDTTSGKVRPNTNSSQLSTGTIIGIPVTGKCNITVTAYQAGYEKYTINGTPASGASTTIEYDGGEGYVNIVSTDDGAYIAGISVQYPAKEVVFVPQTVMPFVPAGNDAEIGTSNLDTDGIPKGSVENSITVQPVGQKLNITNAGGVATTAFASINNLGYYIFPATKDNNVLEFDVVVTGNSATANDAGFFAGIFTNDYMSTLGLRAGGTKIRGVYTKNVGASGKTFTAGEFAGAGSPAEEVVGLNRQIHYKIALSAGKTVVTISFVDDDGVIQERGFSQGLPEVGDTSELYFGIMVARVSATITNMVYKNANGTILYDQNACYYPDGSAPVVTADSVAATAAESREYIDIEWSGDVPEGDGTYVVEMKLDEGEWTEITQDVTGFSYRYTLPEGEGGNYLFRVCGQLGKKTLGGERNDYVTMKESVYVLAALARPVVDISAAADSISLDWQDVNGADYYLVYRYSFDEGADKISQIAKVTESEYLDKNITKEMPYYYQVKAVSSGNESPMSDEVWAVATAGHTGDYVYEDEATEIFLTKKSYDTVYTSEVTLEGVVLGEGTLQLMVNGEEVKSEKLAAREEFSFVFDVAEGRNDVNLLFTDNDGKITRKTFNYVYLTNYDMIVDAEYTGTDGEGDIPTYKTVQAAVDAVSSSNTSNKVILVKAGSYEERLVVDKPYVSLIGEDMEMTNIHFYPGKLGSAYEAGGDMDKRCAIYIKSSAKGFSAENIGFANDYVYATPDNKSNKSADAIRVEADNSTFVNVKFTGVQDTLYMHTGKQYYYKCTIEGLIDFIYSGDDARSFFNDCQIIFQYESTKSSGYVCAPKTSAGADYGLTFYNCVITGEEGCSGNGYLLARPWGPDAYITWIDCYMGKSVYKILPYSAMSGNQYQDARFFEFGTYGPAFQINSDRRQISPNKAAQMITSDYLGWNPQDVSGKISSDHYVGNVMTNSEKKYVINEFATDKYLWTDGDDTGLKMYDQEGYASAYGVSGGGLLKEESANYYAVKSAKEFLDALMAVKKSGKNSVIELQADINLGSKEVAGYSSYSSVIKEYSAQALTHPTLIQTGVSVLSLTDFHNLTIFSSNGSSIKHANITMKNSSNIMIRNIAFDELWEWDEVTSGDYDRNDWDYMTIDQGCDGIWIDHCTFYKAYDGVVDIKNPAPTDNVTISWCEFLPGSEDNIFFNEMMDTMAANPSEYPYYQSLKDKGMSEEQIWWYAYGQKKTHLLGQSDDATNAAGIQLTMANNYYKDSMDRMPRLRYGYSHVYNCIMDAQELLDAKDTIADPDAAKHIVSNGASSTCGGQVLLENCYINGIVNALNSGNGSSPAGYINAINTSYYMYGKATTLAPKSNTTADDRVLITDADAFIAALPYSSYYLYDAEDLSQIIIGRAGAGKIVLTNLQWEKTSYNADYVAPEVNKVVKAEISEISEDVMTDEIKKATGCETVDELIVMLKTLITEGAQAGDILSGIDINDTVAIDVAVLISFDGEKNWEPVTAENFPAEGLDVLIDYPENTNRKDYDFVIGHLNTMGVNGTKIGDMEYFNPTKTADGLLIHITSASPFVIGWKEIEKQIVPPADDDDDDDDTPSSTDIPTTGIPAETQPAAPTEPAATPEAGGAAVDTSDANVGSIRFSLMAMLMSGIMVAYVLFDKKRKVTK